MKVPKEIAELVPYKPGKPIAETKRELGLSEVVKLASNENPLGPSPHVIEALKMALGDLHRYPDAAGYEALQDLSKYYGVPTNWISIGNGSNEIIDLLLRIYGRPGDEIYTSHGAFIAYKICAQVCLMRTVETPMTDELGFDLQRIKQKVLSSTNAGNRLVFLANPNNPTGAYLNKNEVLGFLESMQSVPDTMVVLDEAYCEYVRAKDYPDGVKLLEKFPNVVVTRTFSKVFGVAGLRLGVLLARPEVVDLYNRVRNPFNVNSLAQVAVSAVLKDADYIRRAREINGEGLDQFYREFDRHGVRYWRSEGNFVLVDVGGPSLPIYERMLRKGVIVRPVANYGLLTQLRISVGLPEENQKAVQALVEAMSEEGRMR